MTSILAYISGLKWSIRNIKVWLWLYLCNFALATLAAVPLMNLLEEKLGKTFAAQQLMEGFDYTVFTDFMREYGSAIAPILNQSQLLIILYLFMSIFLMGGILDTCRNSPQKAYFQSFVVGSIKYFWRLSRMTIYFMVIHGLVFFLFFKLFMSLIHGGDLKQLTSELVIYNRGGIVLGIYFFVVAIILTIHDFAKIYLVDNNSKWVYTAIKNGVKIVFKNFKPTFFLSFLNWFVFGLFSVIYLILRGDDLNSTIGELWFIFSIGQVFIFIRIGLKILNLESKTLLFKQISKEQMR